MWMVFLGRWYKPHSDSMFSSAVAEAKQQQLTLALKVINLKVINGQFHTAALRYGTVLQIET